MIPVSTEYRQQLIAGNRNWVVSIPVFLKGNTSGTPDFTLTNENVWENGVVLDEAISSDTSFDLGTAIVGSLKVTIDNINGNFSQYDFYDAKLTLWLGVEGDLDSGVQRYYRIGFYVVDVPTYNGSLITLNCLDNMIWFDTPFKEVTGITYPATAETVVRAICTHCAVTLSSGNFPNHDDVNTKILAAPEEDLTCRDVLQYIAQMCCCYCKINTAGQLVLTWYDKTAITGLVGYDGGTYNTTTTPYSDGDDVQGGRWYWDGDTYVWENLGSYDGGTFTDLQNNAYLSQNFEIEVSTDDIVVTGCRVRNNRSKESAYDVLWVDSTLELTHDRYVLVIDDNPFITTQSKANAIANIVGQTLAGLPMRGFTATSLADFSIETGDMATIVDFRGNTYYTWITHFTFTTNNSENFSCGVQSVKKRSEQRFSTLAETIEKARVAIDAYDAAVAAMNELAQNSIGYREYYYPNEATLPENGRVTYRYNGTSIVTTDPANPKFPNSTVVFKISGDGVFVATQFDSSGTPTYTNGYDANSGTAILNLLYAQGLNAKWITAGQIDTARLNVAGVITAINNNTTTTINGGKITTGTMNADRIGSGTIDAGTINVTNIKAGNIASGDIAAARMQTNALTAVKANVTELSVISANMGTLTAGEITGTSVIRSYRGNVTTNGYTLLSGGSVRIQTDSNNYFQVQYTNNHKDNRVTFGRYISVRDENDYSPSVYDDFYYGDFFYALYDARAAHRSDRKTKKKIKDIPVKKSRAVILGARPRYFEFKKTTEGGIRSGFVAQELRQALDKAGDKTAIERASARRKGEREVLYEDFIAHLVNTTQDLYKTIDRQQEEIDLLKQEVALLKKKVGV